MFNGVSERGDIRPWLENIYVLVEWGDTENAIDTVFDVIDELLDAGNFMVCDAVLRNIDVQRLDIPLMLAILSITLCAASHLPYREELVSTISARVYDLEPDRADKLMEGLVHA